MNIKLVKLTHEYKQQLTDMMDEWLAVEQDFSPYAIRKSDYHDFDNYLENLELKRHEMVLFQILRFSVWIWIATSLLVLSIYVII